MSNEQIFYNAILSRSQENEKAFSLLMNEKLYSLIGCILRLELDSLIRLAFVQSMSSQREKDRLYNQFIRGQRWTGEKELVTDRKMVNNIVWNIGLGWAAPIYDICCAFIHLSPYHDWAAIEPTTNLTLEQRKEIVEFVKSHQKKELSIDFCFENLVEIAGGVFEKLNKNLHCLLKNKS